MLTEREPLVFIIILSWNGRDDTLECLDSIKRLTYQNFHVVVIDNGSEDGTSAALRAQYPESTVIENATNLGYTGGNNIGIKYALERDAKYVWLLNNDAVVTPDSLGALVQKAERSDRVGLVSPIVCYYDSPNEVQFRGAVADHRSRRILHGRHLPALDHEHPDDRFVLWGTALLIKRALIERVGYLNERYFAYHEDVEYSLRATEAGFANVIAPSAIVYHKNARSTGGVQSPLRMHLMTRNWYFLWTRNLNWFQRWTYSRSYLVRALAEAIAVKEEGFPLGADACLDGAWSALRGAYGPPHPRDRMPTAVKRLFYSHPYFWIATLRGEYGWIITTVLKGMRSKIQRRRPARGGRKARGDGHGAS